MALNRFDADRASSTVLDVVLFLLLVGAAVGVLAGVERVDPTDDRVADETADVLATSTVETTYTRSATVASASLTGDADRRAVDIRQTARGTYAELLAAATVADPELSGRSLVGTGDDRRQQVRTAVERVLPTREATGRVQAAWRPYPDAPLEGRVTAGDPPPADADVSATTLVVPSGFDAVRSEAVTAAGSDGYAGVASATAQAVVEGLFPPAQTRAALYSEGPDRVLTAHRYRTASAALGVNWHAETDSDDSFGPRDVESANGRLAEALAARLRADMSSRYDSPVAAARAVRVRRVRVVVGTWSP